MQWAARITLAGLLLGSASTIAIAANVDLIGATADTHLDRSARHAHAAAREESPVQQAATDGQWLADSRSGCRVLDTNFDDGDTVAWSGACRDGLAEGPGTLSFSNEGQLQESITASFHRGVVQDGHVVATWTDGSKYDGDEKAGHMSGAGVFTSAQGDHLEGNWIDDSLAGRVRIAWANGDHYEGEWHDGKANGQGTEIWANGDRYEGNWRDGKADGTGAQKWADGRSFSGAWKDDLPVQSDQRARADMPLNSGTASMARSNVDLPPPASVRQASATMNSPVELAAAPTTAIANSAGRVAGDAVEQGKSAILDGLAGTRLVSVDGSSIAFTATESGFEREIARADGAAQATSFMFINDRLGTVANAEDQSQTIGLFRVRDSEIDVDYADGRSEVLKPNSAGGLSIALAAPDGRSYCMSWYPQDHAFSTEERNAAVAAYASRLNTAVPPQSGACSDGSLAKAAVTNAESHASAPTANLRNLPRPIPRPMKVSFRSTAPVPWQPGTPAPLGQDAVLVRDSVVHTIDAAVDPAAPSSQIASLQPGAIPDSASSCLSIDSDGAHWGFRNRCGYSVQFAYCVMTDPDGLASCRDGGVAGSVAPNGFGALVADKSLKEMGGDHDFRWIACSGGAGEVVPKLDRADPTGRPVRASETVLGAPPHALRKPLLRTRWFL